MIRSLLALFVAGLGWMTTMAGADPVLDREVPRKIVYLGDARPILLELYVRIDGKPVTRVWEDFVSGLLDQYDDNRDGVLSKTEASRVPPPAALLSGAPVFAGPRGKSDTRLDANGDGKVTFQELASYYRTNGLAPFGITFGPKQTGVIRIGADQPPSADASDNRVFELLDTNRDGKLSRTELEAAPGILGKLDVDEDEMLTHAELMGRGRQPGNDGTVQLAISTTGAMPTSAGPFHLVGEGTSDPALGKRLLERYGEKGAKGVTRKRLGLDGTSFGQLDRNRDGKLDVEELSRLGSLRGEASFTVRLGKRSEKVPIVEVHRSPRGMTAKASGSGVTLDLGMVRIALGGPRPAGPGFFAFDVKEQYVTQFRMADVDSNGYLDRAEAEKSPFFRATFRVMDRDGDGKLFEKEMLAYVERMEKLRKQAERSCVSLALTDEGKGLFEILDGDGDGRLSVREMRRLASALTKLDRDGDGSLARTEVPRGYQASFDLGSASTGGFARRVVLFRSDGDGPGTPAERKKGPLWFRKMDRNRDGDLSRREWLGTAEQFNRIDTDGDGLISLEEAERHDRLKRTREQ